MNSSPAATAGTTALQGTAHPSVFLVLYLPYGIAGGYVLVTLAYLLPLVGLSVTQVAALTALFFFPQTWKVLWAPIVDMTLSIHRWYVIGAVTTGALILATALVPARRSELWLLDAMVLALSVALSIVGMASENLMAHATSPQQKGRAGGWCQAGSLGGQGLGGGAALWLAQHMSAWSAGATLALACIGCCAALWTLPESIPHAGDFSLGARLREVGRDVWSVARSRGGLLAAFLVFMPLSTAAASNLWSAVAGDWRASADVVALVNGLLSGVFAAVGCLVSGYLFDRMNRKAGYVLSGLLLAACAVAMALAPRSATTFEIGAGAAATKYNVLACLSNIPITYMTLVDGAARDRFGPAGMLYTEAAITVVAALLFGSVAVATRRGATAALRANEAS